MFRWYVIRLRGKQIFAVEARSSDDARAAAKVDYPMETLIEVAEIPPPQDRITPYLVPLEFRS